MDAEELQRQERKVALARWAVCHPIALRFLISSPPAVVRTRWGQVAVLSHLRQTITSSEPWRPRIRGQPHGPEIHGEGGYDADGASAAG